MCQGFKFIESTGKAKFQNLHPTSMIVVLNIYLMFLFLLYICWVKREANEIVAQSLTKYIPSPKVFVFYYNSLSLPNDCLEIGFLVHLFWMKGLFSKKKKKKKTRTILYINRVEKLTLVVEYPNRFSWLVTSFNAAFPPQSRISWQVMQYDLFTYVLKRIY